MPFLVNRHMCPTCIFSNCTPILPERFEELRAEWANDNAVQICHYSDSNVGCRGHYEAARRNEIPHPLPDIAAEVLGIRGLPIDDLMQICERRGYVQFVEVPDEPAGQHETG